MARRASSGVHPVWFAVVGLLVAGAIAAGYFVFSQANDPYRTMQPLNVAGYLENANSLRGNNYRVVGTVWDSLGWSPAAGRLYSIEVGEGKQADPLPILVPAALNHVNLQKGQRFVFHVEVSEGGVLLVRDLRKW
jgi:hypothetical protein